MSWIWPSCKEVSTAAARGDALGAGARLHLLVCAYCRRFLRQLGLIDAALRETVFPKADASALEKSLRAKHL